jgi:Flp pilus assembly pilin Flp
MLIILREVKNMNFLKDEAGQGAAEYILLFGGVIVIAIAALLIYKNYIQGSNMNSAQDSQDVRNEVNKTASK